MATVREVVVGGIAGHMIAAVIEKMVAKNRKAAMEHVLGYQHRAPDLEKIPFVDVYSDGEKGDEARRKINWRPAVYPEAGLHYESVERVIVLSDDNPREIGSTRRVVGMVIVRYPDTGPFRPVNDRVVRFKVILEYGYAENGNTYYNSATVSDFEPVAEEDMALSQA